MVESGLIIAAANNHTPQQSRPSAGNGDFPKIFEANMRKYHLWAGCPQFTTPQTSRKHPEVFDRHSRILLEVLTHRYGRFTTGSQTLTSPRSIRAIPVDTTAIQRQLKGAARQKRRGHL